MVDCALQWLQQHLPGVASGTIQKRKRKEQQQQQQDWQQLEQHPASSAADKFCSLPPLLPESLQEDAGQLVDNTATSLAAVNSRSSRQDQSRVSSSWRQSISNAANKLSCTTVMDLNSGLCSAELSWHVRTEHQPARMAVKLSNRQHTRVTFDAQVALRRAGPMLRVAGSPQGIHAASVLIKPSRQPVASTAAVAGMSSPETAQDGTAQPNPSTASSAQPSKQAAGPSTANLQPANMQAEAYVTAGSSSPCLASHQSCSVSPRADAQHVQHDRGASSLSSSTSSSSTNSSSTGRSNTAAPLQQGRPRQRQRRPAHTKQNAASQQPASPAARADGLMTASKGQPTQEVNSAASSQRHSHMQATVHSGSNAPVTTVGAAAGTAPAQTLWEMGWNWKIGGPIVSVTKQFDTSNRSSGNSSSSSSGSLLTVQQLKAAYDAKSRSYTLTAGSGGWNVTMNVPTHNSGAAGLVRRVWQVGCRPKITLSLVPELTCF